MESGHLPACFLAILGPFDPSMEALVCLTRLQEYRVEECLILVSLASAQGRQSVQTNIDAYCSDLFLSNASSRGTINRAQYESNWEACARDPITRKSVTLCLG